MDDKAWKSGRLEMGQVGFHRKSTKGKVPFVGARAMFLPSRAPRLRLASKQPAVIPAWS
jgi:hypothetical protein